MLEISFINLFQNIISLADIAQWRFTDWTIGCISRHKVLACICISFEWTWSDNITITDEFYAGICCWSFLKYWTRFLKGTQVSIITLRVFLRITRVTFKSNAWKYLSMILILKALITAMNYLKKHKLEAQMTQLLIYSLSNNTKRTRLYRLMSSALLRNKFHVKPDLLFIPT